MVSNNTLVKYRYAVLAVLSLLAALEVLIAFYDPTRPLLDWPLILTFLAWLGVVGLIITVASADGKTKAFAILVIFPLVLCTWIGLFWFMFVPYVSIAAGLILGAGVLAALASFSRVLILGLISLLATMGVSTALFDRLASRHRAKAAAGHLMMFLGVSIAALALYFVLALAIPAAAAYYWVLLFLALLINLAAVPIVVTVLIGRTKPSYQRIVAGALVLWIVVMIGGWARYTMMSNGLEGLVGEERTRAVRVLTKARNEAAGCYGLFAPEGRVPSHKRVRVVKDDDGLYNVKYYTWWGIPTDSECYRRSGT